MKRFLTTLLVLGLVASAFAVPAAAKKKAKPVATTLYFHGTQFVGEIEIPDVVNGVYRTMDATEPTDPAPKSVALAAVGVGGSGTPNPTCAGSPLFPVWVGNVAGRIVGDIKFSLPAVAAPVGQVEVRVWGAVPGPTACDSSVGEMYVEPNAAAKVDLPAGPGSIEAVLEDVDFQTTGRLMVQVTPLLDTPTAARVLYDSTTFVGQLEFSCIPSAGAKTCA